MAYVRMRWVHAISHINVKFFLAMDMVNGTLVPWRGSSDQTHIRQGL